jgi:hypothetical protein
MTESKFPDDANKDFDINNIENILAHFVDDKGICKICGHYHRFNPRLEGVKTSIDIIKELLDGYTTATTTTTTAATVRGIKKVQKMEESYQ